MDPLSKFFVPWVEIDPQLRSGGIDGRLAGAFVGPALGDNKTTKNTDVLEMFIATNLVAASVSQHPVADMQNPPDKAITDVMIRGLNELLKIIVNATKAGNTKFHYFTHARPPANLFPIVPIRFPLRNTLANEFVHFLIGELGEVAECSQSAGHTGLDLQASEKLIAPLYAIKAKFIKRLFGLEVAGELSQSELYDLLEGKRREGSVNTPDESTVRPDAADLAEAMSGVDVIQWSPEDVDWVNFADIRRNTFTAENLIQPEGARTADEDFSHEQPIGGDGNPIIVATNGQPG